MEPCCPGSCNDVSSCPIYHSNLDLDSDATLPEIIADGGKNVLAPTKEEPSHHPNKVSLFIVF